MKKSALFAVLGTAIVLAQPVAADQAIGACTESKVAVCDLGWNYKTQKGEDQCFWGKKAGKYTIPKGTFGIFGDPENYGWLLIKDAEGDRDYWCK